MNDMDAQVQSAKQWLGVNSINLFGRPFCGKDTQGRMLADLLGGVLIGGGDILRSHHDPAQIEQVMASGGLIPSDFYFDLVLPYLSQEQFKDRPLILDAVGRSSGEEQTIVKACEHSGHPLRAVILLDISEEEVWKRFDAAGEVHDRDDRTDDTADVLRNRLQKFQEKTMPVIEFYRRQGLLVTVNGAQSREDVLSETIGSLARLANA